jgi:cell division protein FtsI (penicillin-binding protein 3)
MLPAPRDTDKKRVMLVSIGLVLLFCFVLIRYYQIQIIEGEQWVAKAKNQHELTVTEPFIRGRFLLSTKDQELHPKKNVEVTQNLYKFHFFIDPLSIPRTLRDEVAYNVVSLIKETGISWESIRPEFDRKSRSRRLQMWLHRQQREKIEKWWKPYARKHHLPLNALYFVRDSQRAYPFSSMLGQLLHTIRDNKDQVTKQGIPTGGLELQYQEELKGQQGKRLLLRSPRHAMETGTILQNPENGKDIVLTIDPVIQAIAEREIKLGVVYSQAKSGWAVMMDPHNGHILAVAQYPFFWPEDYQKFYNNSDLLPDTRLHCVLDSYEPGSTFKPINMALCLQANEFLKAQGKPPLFDPEEKIASSNGRFPGRFIKPIEDTRTHYYLNLDLGIQRSSNIYIGRVIQRLIERLGSGWYYNALKDLVGVGIPTNVEYPIESKGMLPVPGALNSNGSLQWSLPTPYSLAMGYNLQMNSLQLVKAYALLANGGYEVSPTFIQESSNSIKKKVRRLDSSVVERVIQSLKYVTKTAGALKKGDVPGYTEVGKTGTVRKLIDGKYSKRHYFSSFVGFCPAKEARFVLYVGIDEPSTEYVPGWGHLYYGGNNASPVFREISKQTLKYLGVPQDDPYGDFENPVVYDPMNADWYSEAKELQKLYEQWNQQVEQ